MEQYHRIYFWHGIDKNSKCFKRIDSIATLIKVGDEEYYSFEGSLDHFNDMYDGNFIYLKGDSDKPSMICVTQHNSFAAR